MELLKIKNILEELKKEEEKEQTRKIKQNKIFEQKNGWTIFKNKNNEDIYIRQTLTEKQRTKTKQEQKTILLKKELKTIDKKYNDYFLELEQIEKSEDIELLEIITSWTPSKMWGYNPKTIIYTNNKVYESESIGGCGYDKESTATAQALNQIKGLKKIILLKLSKKNKNYIKKFLKSGNRDFLGYGLSSYYLPYFSGGVGFNCHDSIIQKLGFKKATDKGTKTSHFTSFIKKG